MLPDEAKAKLDELVTKLKADPNGAYFEIEGHTDALGAKALNEKIGLDRAEAVKRYLFEQHQIPLHRMNVISYGTEKPVASNKTQEGRAQNRRVVIGSSCRSLRRIRSDACRVRVGSAQADRFPPSPPFPPIVPRAENTLD